ncbi:ABC transporter permease [Flexivirga endophytica]|uniref:ABC transporter permease n=1 Tax=Flexivirga endophytica TaxID=1849103 RepID=A0A916T2G5_9MICO|nr:ABC-2 family transporter protein [Flexivirga endophytica]GGB27399.1 ABC transporter permease [Flexivirga endophytica]GHB55883.1 ABC transporter permease [Flexivirga endophytica]
MTLTAETDAIPTRFAGYRAVLASRMRSQRSYRSNFVIDLASSGLVGLIELAEVWLLFHQVTVLGGLNFTQVLLVFGLADMCYSIADMVVGHCDTLPKYIREGTLDVFYLRPQPLLLQLMTSDISLRRLTRAGIGLTSLVIALCINDIHWSVAHVALLVLTIVCAIAIFSAMYIWAAGVQFFLIQGAEFTNAFVYGGRYAATQPAAVWSLPLKGLFGFVFPMALAAYVPALRLLDLPGPAGMPNWLAWCTPVAAVWMWGFALIMWRFGVRHYQGGGG